ncbi:MAG TPA: hypothetical protein VD926_00250 [Acidimicrobiales bacterium]|nr:hypothetical protein [Acidimicrobiales bacterium]
MSDTDITTEETEVVEETVPVVVLTNYDVLAGTFGGYECVSLVLEVNDGTEELKRVVVVSSSEDALTFAGGVKSVASTVRPFSVQERIRAAAASREESN